MDDLIVVECLICGRIHTINDITPIGHVMRSDEPIYPTHCPSCDCSSCAVLVREEIEVK